MESKIHMRKHVARSCGYKFLQGDDKFSKPFQSYLGEDVVHNFSNNMLNESKYFIDVMKKKINKKVAMTKKDEEDFENYTKC